MGNLAPPPRDAIACGVCTGFAIIATMFRLLIRFRRSRLWIDDILATISACALLAQLLILFINPDQQNGVVRFYDLSDTLYTTVWFARLSMLFSIIRIARGALCRPRGLYVSAALFLAIWAFLTGELFWDCERKTSWKHLATPRCDVSRFTSSILLITDVFADGILLYYPIQLFMVIRETRLRFRLIMIFGTCIITIIPSVVYMVYSFDMPNKPSFLAHVIKAAVSLVVCHIPVLVTAAVRVQEQKMPSSPPSRFLEFCAVFSKSQMTTISTAAEVDISKSDPEKDAV